MPKCKHIYPWGETCKREAGKSTYCFSHKENNLKVALSTPLPSDPLQIGNVSRADLDTFSSAFTQFIDVFKKLPGVSPQMPMNALQNLQTMHNADSKTLQDAFWTILRANNTFQAHLDKFKDAQLLDIQLQYNNVVSEFMECAFNKVLSNTARAVRQRSAKNFGPKNLLACAEAFEEGINRIIRETRPRSMVTPVSGALILGYMLLCATTNLWNVWVYHVLFFASLHAADYGSGLSFVKLAILKKFLAVLATSLYAWSPDMKPEYTISAMSFGAFERRHNQNKFPSATVQSAEIIPSNRLTAVSKSELIPGIMNGALALASDIFNTWVPRSGQSTRDTIGHVSILVFILANMLKHQERQGTLAAATQKISRRLLKAIRSKNPDGYPTNLRFLT